MNAHCVIGGKLMAGDRIARTIPEIMFMKAAESRKRDELESLTLDHLTKTQEVGRCLVCQKPLSVEDEAELSEVCLGCQLIAEIDAGLGEA